MSNGLSNLHNILQRKNNQPILPVQNLQNNKMVCLSNGIEIVGDGKCSITLMLETQTGDIYRTVHVNSKGECNDTTELNIIGKKLENKYLLQGIQINNIRGKDVLCTNCRYIVRIYKDGLRKHNTIICINCKKKGTYIPQKDASKEFQHYFLSDINIDGILV